MHCKPNSYVQPLWCTLAGRLESSPEMNISAAGQKKEKKEDGAAVYLVLVCPAGRTGSICELRLRLIDGLFYINIW